MSTIKEDLRTVINKVLERVDEIEDNKKKQLALLGIQGTLEDIIKTIKEI